MGRDQGYSQFGLGPCGVGFVPCASDAMAEERVRSKEALPTRWYRGMNPSPACNRVRLGFVFRGLFQALSNAAWFSSIE